MRVKMVRDKIVFPRGETPMPVNTIIGKRGFLLLKLHEETEEIARAPGDAGEYADLLEAMLELARINGVPWYSIEREFLRKREELGGFRLGRIWTGDRERGQ